MSLQIIEMKVADLVPYAMNAKQHPAEQVAQIAASIEEFGMNDPVAVWHNADGVPIIVEGHGRVLALQKLKCETCPVICLDDLSDAQRRAYTLVHNQLTLNSGFDIDMLNSELAQIKTDLPSLDMGQFDLRINDDTPDNVYTAKIDTPVYTPQSDTPPALSALYDHSKTDELLTYIKANIKDTKLRKFLTHAAYRFTVFNYDQIAEYYSHLPQNERKIFEKLALVIVDYDNAIENGFIKMTKTLQALAEEALTNEE